jgi:hypothetical protein
VYRDALRALIDVIVFPADGPRPLPDQMAGSDLDGDEYVVIFDADFMFVRNERPLTYTVEAGRAPVNPFKTVDDAANFFVKQMSDNTVGVFGNRSTRSVCAVILFLGAHLS